MKFLISTFCFYWLVLTSSIAQYANQIHFKNISVKDGLSFPAVTCMLQDEKGFMWVGTNVGLNKYDSQKFKGFYANAASDQHLSNNNITSLYEDEQQNIWVGTFKGLNVYQRNTATFLSNWNDGSLDVNRILAITGNKKGQIWVLTAQQLFLLNPQYQLLQKYHLRDLTEEKEIIAFSTMKMDTADDLWINTNKGLRKLDVSEAKLSNATKDYDHYLLSNIEFFSTLYFDNSGRIWVSSRGNGLKFYEPKQQKWQKVPNLSSNYVNGIIEAKDGRFWIATGRNGLNIYDVATNKVEVIRYADTPESNFTSNSLSCIYQDKAGGIWIGTFNTGLQYYYQQQLKYNLYYSKGQVSGFNSNYVTAFVTDAEDNIWIGAGEEGLLYYNRKTGAFTNVRPFQRDPQNIGASRENFYIFSLLLSDDDEHLYIGTLTGFYDYHIPTKRWKYIHYQRETAQKNTFDGVVVSMKQDEKKVYLATFDGLSIYDKQAQTVRNIPTPQADFQLFEVEQNDSILYLGSRYFGIWQFSKQTEKLTKIRPQADEVSIPDFVARMYLDKQKRLVVSAYAKGTFRYNSTFTKMEYLAEKEQGKKLITMSICEAPSSGYWMATNQGLVKVGEDFSIEEIFDQNEGFEPSYFSNNALYKSPTNEILIGGNTGFYSFFPTDFYQPRKVDAAIHLTDFLLLNKSVIASEVAGFRVQGELEEKKQIELPQYQNLLTFEYAALDYHNPAQLQYVYRLEPYEKEWNQVGNRRFATYRDLPAGNYTFKVKYLVNEEKFSEQSATLQVSIPPKPWETWWAYLLYGSVLFWLSRTFYLYRKNRRRFRQELTMQKFQKEKMKEFYQFKIDFFTQVTHELRTPLTLISGPLEEIIQRNKNTSNANLLEIIYRNTKKLLRTVNQVLDFRKIENLEMKVFAKKGNIVAFAEEILNSFQRMATNKGVDLQFETNMAANPFVLFDKDIVEKILVNLIANALKFTDKGLIRLEISKKSKQSGNYSMQLSDTGRGIKKENLPHIFESFFQEKRENTMVGSGLGLKIVKELVDLHHGVIKVDSTLHKGTTFLLSFPVADLDLVNEEPVRPSIAKAMEQRFSSENGTAITEKTEKILIVDDEADVLAFLADVFAQNYQVFTVDAAQKAIDIAKTEMPDLIISDVMMPDMDGLEFCTYAKSDFLLNHIPVILLTALDATEHEIEGLNTGADAYISKPFPINLLKATVQNLLISRQQLKKAFLNTSLHEPALPKQKDSNQEFIDKVIAIIHQNLAETHLEISDISSELGMSPSTFYRKIKSLTGVSGNEFIRTVRLKKSLAYLKNSDLNISEIAYRVGFSDPKYFSTCFKKLYGITPSEYLLQQKRN